MTLFKFMAETDILKALIWLKEPTETLKSAQFTKALTKFKEWLFQLLYSAKCLKLQAVGGGGGLMVKKGPITGERRNILFKEGSAQDRVNALVAALQKDGIDFSVGIDISTPIIDAERVVSAGKGIGGKENMKLVEELAKAAGCRYWLFSPCCRRVEIFAYK